MRFVSITFIVLAMIILFPQRAFSQFNDPCMVTVEWISVDYPQGDIGNDWTFIAKVNGQAKAVKTNLVNCPRSLATWLVRLSVFHVLQNTPSLA